MDPSGDARLCSVCSRRVGRDAEACPHCGADFHEIPTRTTLALTDPPPPAPFPPGADFADRYTIIERVGAGGMGVVYKATDRVLDQTVALKLIQPALALHAAFIERFKREVRVTREMNHPNICRVHDLGTGNGHLYLSMEFIKGETLRSLLRRAGRIERERALRIAGQIASALDAAHSKGVVHRDLKPENVMIDDRGQVHVMDFGLATDLASLGASLSAQPMGTVPYTAPEQMRGETVDGRADLYALGIILREMMSGIPPTAPSADQSRARTGIPSRVLRVIDHLAAPERDRRYASATEAAEKIGETRAEAGGARSRIAVWGLRAGHLPLTLAGVLVLAVLGSLAAWIQRDPRPPEVPTATEGYYRRGIHYLREQAESVESLNTALAMFYRALATTPEDPKTLAAIGETLWIRYDRTRDAVSRAEAADHVARAIAIDPWLPEAINARARGRIAEGDFAGAREDLGALIGNHPDLDPAWANLGRAAMGLNDYDGARRAIRRAIRIRPDSFQHRILLGNLHETFSEFDEAESAYRKAIDLKPDSAMAWGNLGAVLLRRSPIEAKEALTRSLDIEDNALARSNLGTACYFTEQYDDAERNYRRAAALDPRNPDYRGNLGDALEALGRDQEAREAWLEAVGLALELIAAAPSDPAGHKTLATWCGRAGLKDCAEREGALAREMRPLSAEVLFRYAAIAASLGRRDEAFSWLDQAVRLGLARVEIVNDPALAAIRDDPRWAALIERAR